MCSASACRDRGAGPHSRGLWLVSNPWSDHSLLALWIPSQAASLHVVETKIFQLEDISQPKNTHSGRFVQQTLSATAPGVSSFFVELGLLCAGWDILGRDKPARCKDFTRPHWLLITGLDWLSHLSDKLLILGQTSPPSPHYIITVLLSITQLTSSPPSQPSVRPSDQSFLNLYTLINSFLITGPNNEK